MNHKQQVAAMHARELRIAKDELLIRVNQKLQEARSKGYYAEVTPQIQRLIGLDKYRQRDVIRMQQLVSNPDKLQEYIYVVNKDTGVPLSGEKAMTRYSQYERSRIYKPASEEDIVVDNTAQTIADTFVDESVLDMFQDILERIQSNPESIEAQELFNAHPDWANYHWTKVPYAAREMVKENNSNILEMKSAIRYLIAQEGRQEVARRIRDNWGDLNEAAVMAAIGYEKAAASALQTVLKIFLPSAVHNRAMRGAMSDMQEAIESQFDYEE